MPNETEGSAILTEDAGNPDVATDWTQGLDDYQEVIEAKGWKGTDDVLKSYVNLEKQVGADKVVLPTDGSDLSEWEGWQKLGTPEKAEDYQLAAPEGFEAYNQDLSDWFRGAAHEMKLPAAMAQGLHDRFVEQQMAQMQAAQTQAADQQAEWEGELQNEYGNAFPKRVEAAKRAMREYGSDELRQVLNDSGLGSNPHIVRAFANMGMTLESGPQFKEGESAGQFGTTPEMSKEQMAQIRGNPAYWDNAHPEHKALVAKMARLAEHAHGSDPVAQNVSVG